MHIMLLQGEIPEAGEAPGATRKGMALQAG